MKKAILFIILISLSLSAIAQPRTIKSEMEKLHQTYGVNFVYDSSIELNISSPVKYEKKQHHSIKVWKRSLPALESITK